MSPWSGQKPELRDLCRRNAFSWFLVTAAKRGRCVVHRRRRAGARAMSPGRGLRKGRGGWPPETAPRAQPAGGQRRGPHSAGTSAGRTDGNVLRGVYRRLLKRKQLRGARLADKHRWLRAPAALRSRSLIYSLVLARGAERLRQPRAGGQAERTMGGSGNCILRCKHDGNSEAGWDLKREEHLYFTLGLSEDAKEQLTA